MRKASYCVFFLAVLFCAGGAFAQTDLFFSEYIEGSSNNKALEIYNGTGAAVDLAAGSYAIQMYFNGNASVGLTINLTGVVANGDVYVVAHSSADAAILAQADQTSGAGFFNGDDAVVLVKGSTVIDAIGQIGYDPGSQWSGGGIGTQNETLRRKSTILAGDTNPNDAFDPSVEWDGFAQDTFDGLGSHTVNSGETAPFVAATTPANGAAGVTVDTNIDVSFNEDVSATGSWFSIDGATSGSHTATVSGGPQNFTLNPDVDFDNGETVTVTIFAAQVSDLDTDDPPDNMTADFVFSFTPQTASPGWVINEINADPDASNGDANGDGTVSTTQDEFVEIINNTGSAVDISGWTISDGVGVRHTFPSGTIVPDQCPVVVFGGGTPTGSFGGAVVQTASTGTVGLNNGGDVVKLNNGSLDVAAYTYGSEGGDNQSLTRDPDVTGPEPLVKHSTATGSGGALFSPGMKIDSSLFPGCVQPPQILEIFEIQGSGLASPVTGQSVTTENNVVTAIAPNGFFMQTPAARTDGDPNTSDGIFVFTGSAPSVAVGDNVTVSGEVAEFFNFTELSNTTSVTVNSSGNPLPAAVEFDATKPDPTQPQSAIEFERFEGMLVQIETGVVTGPNQHFASDPIAEVFIVAKNTRTFREPGIEFPGLASLPVWDGNPEVFELDPDKLGLPNQIIPAGSSFEAVGILGFEFGDYEFWPTDLSVTPVSLPDAVRSREDGEFTVGSLNLFRLFDDVKDGSEEVVSTGEYNRRLTKFSQYIRNVLNSPDILAFQEAEKIGVLQDLASQIATDDPSVLYSAYLEEGNDVGGIDVGFLVRATVHVDAVTQLGASETLSVDGSLLHDRPPLLLEGSFLTSSGPQAISVMAVHNRSLNGIDDASDGPRVRQKRLEQAQSIAQKVQDIQDTDPDVRLVVLGDFNAFEFTDGYVDAVGQIKGDFDPDDNLLSGPDLVDPNLTDQVLGLAAAQRYSFVHVGNAQVLDHALTSQALNPKVTGFQYGRGNADAAVDLINDDTTPLRSSDHDGLVLFVDVTPPQITVLDEPAQLWPPNHTYQTFEVSDFVLSVDDDEASEVFITSVTSDEPENATGNGDGNTEDDIVIIDCQTVDLRAERAGAGNGRVYTIYLASEDAFGNVGTAAFQVHVPKSQGSGGAIDDGAVYEVQSNCDAGDVGKQNLAQSGADPDVETNAIPTEFALEQNYPNPFNPATTIRFALPQAGHVTLRIFNSNGQLVKTLVSKEMAAGTYNLLWNGENENGAKVASGVYLYQLSSGAITRVKKMIFLK